MQSFHDLLTDVMTNGEWRGDRTGTGTTSVFGRTIRFNMAKGFPLMTTKRVPFKSVAAELLWFISGGTNIIPLLANGCTIWTDWPLKTFNAEQASRGDALMLQEDFERGLLEGTIDECHGDLGPVYGAQWRRWQTNRGPIDQLDRAIRTIRENPMDRRILVSAWNPADLPYQALPPCHFAFQFYCHTDGRLSIQTHMRSTDIFLGLPFNIASYALLLHMVAGVTGRTPGDLIITMGDLHLYNNHREQAVELLARIPKTLPTLNLPTKAVSLEDYTLDDIRGGLEGYMPYPPIVAPIAV
jgi:thymidylate synthase